MLKISLKDHSTKGIATGNVFIVKRDQDVVNDRLITDAEKKGEETRFMKAVDATLCELSKLALNHAIFSAHLEIARDEMLIESVLSRIFRENRNAEQALKESGDEFCLILSGIDDVNLKERSADVKDVVGRILRMLKGVDYNPFNGIGKEVIIVSDELFPSDMAIMDFSKVRGLITAKGGLTSHVAILAKDKGIPAFTGIGNDIENFRDGDFIILDGTHGELIINPNEETIEIYNQKTASENKRRSRLLESKDLEAVTRDGYKITLMANAGSIEEVSEAMELGASGIGLFRSEYLFLMDKDSFSDEENQFKVYRKAAEICGDKPLIIRTLDIGGDKSLPGFVNEKEENPSLGWRGIRISLDMPETFRTQIRALLRATAYGTIRIMFPMIISLEEFMIARKMVEKCCKELKNEGIRFNDHTEIGVMIETPAAVLMANELASEAGFLSIGTNDLTQYTLAVDRLNHKVAHLCNPFHPALIRSIRMIITEAAVHSTPVGMCGEMAGNSAALLLLLGLGLREFSMNAAGIPEIKYLIRNTSMEKAQKLAKQVCEKKTTQEIMSIPGL